MARSLHKVQKAISKKKGSKPTALHENSRDAQRLRQAGAREDKLARMMNAAARQNQIYVDRVSWFQENVQPADDINDEQLHELVTSFIGREDEELAEIKASKRPGRPPSKAEEQIRGRIDNEEREFRGGLWIPDVRDSDVRDKLGRWAGHWDGLNTMKFVRVVKAGTIKSSSFPPKGLS